MEQRAAVDVVRLSGYERGVFRGEERDELCHIFRFGNASEWNCLAGIGNDSGAEFFQGNALRFGLSFLPVIH